MHINNISQKAASFILHKRFHPGNYKNMERVWVAEQKASEAAEKEKELESKRVQEKRLLELRKDNSSNVLEWVTANEEHARIFSQNNAAATGKTQKEERPYVLNEVSRYGTVDDADLNRKLREDPLMLVMKAQVIKERKVKSRTQLHTIKHARWERPQIAPEDLITDRDPHGPRADQERPRRQSGPSDHRSDYDRYERVEWDETRGETGSPKNGRERCDRSAPDRRDLELVPRERDGDRSRISRQTSHARLGPRERPDTLARHDRRDIRDDSEGYHHRNRLNGDQLTGNADDFRGYESASFGSGCRNIRSARGVSDETRGDDTSSDNPLGPPSTMAQSLRRRQAARCEMFKTMELGEHEDQSGCKAKPPSPPLSSPSTRDEMERLAAAISVDRTDRVRKMHAAQRREADHERPRKREGPDFIAKVQSDVLRNYDRSSALRKVRRVDERLFDDRGFY